MIFLQTSLLLQHCSFSFSIGYFSHSALGNCPYLTSEEEEEGTSATSSIPHFCWAKVSGEQDPLKDGKANCRGDGSPVPTPTGWGFQTHLSSVSHLTCSCWLMSWEWTLGTLPTWTLAVQGILKHRTRRTRGSGCNPNTENISMLRALNSDSDMGTTLETISKNVQLNSNYINFNRWGKENYSPLRFHWKSFTHPF